MDDIFHTEERPCDALRMNRYAIETLVLDCNGDEIQRDGYTTNTPLEELRPVFDAWCADYPGMVVTTHVCRLGTPADDPKIAHKITKVADGDTEGVRRAAADHLRHAQRMPKPVRGASRVDPARVRRPNGRAFQ